MRNCLRLMLPPFRERRGGESTAGERSHAGQQTFCTLTRPSGGLSAPPGSGRSRDDLFAQVRRPGICEPCSRRSRRAPLRLRGRGERQRHIVDCSRCSPAGSITASRSTSSGTPCPTAPAVHRRAPLRRDLLRLCGVHHDRRLPPLTGGLHCGTPKQWGYAVGTTSCSRRSPAGSIAARRSAEYCQGC
jgi:hypothetical protein